MWSNWSELFQIVSLQDGSVSTEFHDVKKQKHYSHGLKSIKYLLILKANLINQKKVTFLIKWINLFQKSSQHLWVVSLHNTLVTNVTSFLNYNLSSQTVNNLAPEFEIRFEGFFSASRAH